MTIIKVIGYRGCCVLSLRKNLPPAVSTFRIHLNFGVEVTLFPGIPQPMMEHCWDVANPVQANIPKGQSYLSSSQLKSAKTSSDMHHGLRLSLLPFTGVRLVSQSRGYLPNLLPPLFIFHRHLSTCAHTPMGNYGPDNPVCSENELQEKERGRRIWGLGNKKDTSTNCNMDLI